MNDETRAIVDRMNEEFMTPEVTLGNWIAYENDLDGVTFVPAQYYMPEDNPSGEFESHIGKYGARLSASGYLDCTDWDIFDTEDEAWEYLAEVYGSE